MPIDDTQKTQNVPKILEVIQKTYLGMYNTLPETGRNKGFQCFSIIYYYYHYYYYHLSSVVIMKQNKWITTNRKHSPSKNIYYLAGPWIHIHFIRIRIQIQQSSRMRIWIRVCDKKKPVNSFLKLEKNIKRLLKRKKYRECKKFTLKHLIKLQSLAISFTYF